MAITMQNMRYAITVAETGSFLQASKELFVSQSTVSCAIKELESQIGFALFERSKSGTVITRQGAEFIRDAELTLEQHDQMTEKYSIPQIAKDRFSVSAQHYTFASAAFSELVNLYDDDTKYEFRLMETKTKEVISDVNRRIAEIGILYISEDNEVQIERILRDADLEFTELFETRPYVLVGGDHPLKKRSGVSLQDLSEYPSINFGQEDLSPLFYSEEALQILQCEKSLIISDRGALADLLSNTRAYLISSGIYMTSCKSDTTVAIPLDCDKVIRVVIVRQKETIPTEVCVKFCELLIQTIKNHQTPGTVM
jgi:DNA-binding transcriptional LysR family regulator